MNENLLRELAKVIAERTLENEGVYVIDEEEAYDMLVKFFDDQGGFA